MEAGLLAAYAVDLLPAEVARRGLRHRPTAAAILRRLDAAPTAVTPPASAPSPVLPASRGAGARASGDTRIIRLPGVVCGVVEGGGIQEVACREGPADAFGIFSAPPASRGSCDGALQWFTHGRTWSACWFVDAGAFRGLRAS